jgi:predicted AlkP superfamily pyrophosphatase or phosphodiesterase
MRFTLRLAVAWAVVLPLLGLPPARADEPQRPERPRLVVIVSLDQFRADYLERFGARIRASGRAGFLRLVREGASWVDCRHRHATTFTGPGHAAIGSGTYAAVSGIVGNEWWERAANGKPGREVYCVDDPGATLFGAPGVAGGKRVGPANFRADSLGDAMKWGLTPTPRVVAVSLKDRSAILLAGRRADAVFWLDPQAGGFVTCDRYAAWNEGDPAAAAARRAAAHARLEAFNATRLPTFVRPWESNGPPGGYPEAVADDRPEEGKGAAFPHAPLNPGDLKHVYASPHGDEALLAFLEETIPLGDAPPPSATSPPRDELAARLALGARAGATDLLCVSFSSPDYVGHRYGPESQEAADEAMRVDGVIERLLAALDAKVGKGRWWLALTADHGAAPVAEWAARVGLDAGRVQASDVKAALEGAVPVEAVTEGNVYLAARESHPVARRAHEDAARDALLAMPGVLRAFTRTQLLEGNVSDDEVGRGAVRSFEASRSGDVVFVLRPYWVWEGPVPGTSHGQPWRYDARVPLLLTGPGVRPGLRLEPASPVDLAATFAALLHVTPPAGCEGRVLSEALDLEFVRASAPLR